MSSPRMRALHHSRTDGIQAGLSFTSGKSEIAVPVRSRLAVSTAEAAIDAAVAGVGITRVVSPIRWRARCVPAHSRSCSPYLL
ncbi:hypothetical protein ACU4GD_31165 [Cupriavidus basilensis]